MDKAELLKLKKGSAAIRIQTLKMLKWRRYGHLGGAMSIVELMSVLYNKQLKYDPKNPQWEDRDYVVLSKGHAAFLTRRCFTPSMREGQSCRPIRIGPRRPAWTPPPAPWDREPR